MMATSNGVWVIKFLLNREDQEFHLEKYNVQQSCDI